jgi:hypothetical protein
MTSVDRLGFHVRLNTQDGIRGTRIAFLREVSNPAETRKVRDGAAGASTVSERVFYRDRSDRGSIPLLLVARTYPAGSDTQRGDAVAPQGRAFLFVAGPD